MLHLKTAPCPAYLRHFRKGELTMARISRAAPFLWPKPCGSSLSGISHKSPPQILVDSPKAVLTQCTIFCRVINIQWIGSLRQFALCRAIEAMLFTTKSQLEIRSSKTLVDVTFFFLTRSQNRRLLRACTSAALDFRLPYCSDYIPSGSSAWFIVYRPRALLCIFSSRIFMYQNIYSLYVSLSWVACAPGGVKPSPSYFCQFRVQRLCFYHLWSDV